MGFEIHWCIGAGFVGFLLHEFTLEAKLSKVLLYAPDTEDARKEFVKLLGGAAKSWILRPMVTTAGGVTGSDLTAVLTEALESLQENGYGATVFVGSDCPDLPCEAIEKAFEVCQGSHKAYICPAQDGGYVLLGVGKSAPKGVFKGVHWSADDTAKSQTHVLENLGINVVQGETYSDVDDFSDLLALNARLDEMSKQERKALCPRVARWARAQKLLGGDTGR